MTIPELLMVLLMSMVITLTGSTVDTPVTVSATPGISLELK